MNKVDEHWMQLALNLARQAQGQTAPNPSVGALVVQDGQAVGAGFHPRAGQPHAEVFALHQAGALAVGATLYVTLEPCNHQGRTPPCTQAILKSGIQRVVVGMIDPNPQVQGQGILALQAAGLTVVTGVLGEACAQVNQAFSHWVRTGRPWGIWKYAMTLDGKIATPNGDSFWVSGELARQRVQELRNLVDGVIVGGATLRRDNPRLTCRLPGGRNPCRIVMSRSLNLPHEAHLWQTQTARTLVFTEVGADPCCVDVLRGHGVEVYMLPQLTPDSVLVTLGGLGMLRVLWECGGTLAWAALQEGGIQQVLAFVSPKFSGGKAAPTPLGGLGVPLMAEALPLHQVTWSQLGADLLVEGLISAELKPTPSAELG
jgi:diaminohydroxyphosphoribosylaminopyrimidine deaminase/5-amino-6-(5-phosphoribosylamino)uracil reductase